MTTTEATDTEDQQPVEATTAEENDPQAATDEQSTEQDTAPADGKPRIKPDNWTNT